MERSHAKSHSLQPGRTFASLKLSPRTLERWRWLGQGPRYLKVGGRVVYRLEDIIEFEEQRLHETDAR